MAGIQRNTNSKGRIAKREKILETKHEKFGLNKNIREATRWDL